MTKRKAPTGALDLEAISPTRTRGGVDVVKRARVADCREATAPSKSRLLTALAALSGVSGVFFQFLSQADLSVLCGASRSLRGATHGFLRETPRLTVVLEHTEQRAAAIDQARLLVRRTESLRQLAVVCRGATAVLQVECLGGNRYDPLVALLRDAVAANEPCLEEVSVRAEEGGIITCAPGVMPQVVRALRGAAHLRRLEWPSLHFRLDTRRTSTAATSPSAAQAAWRRAIAQAGTLFATHSRLEALSLSMDPPAAPSSSSSRAAKATQGQPQRHSKKRSQQQQQQLQSWWWCPVLSAATASSGAATAFRGTLRELSFHLGQGQSQGHLPAEEVSSLLRGFFQLERLRLPIRGSRLELTEALCFLAFSLPALRHLALETAGPPADGVTDAADKRRRFVVFSSLNTVELPLDTLPLLAGSGCHSPPRLLVATAPVMVAVTVVT